MKSEFSLVHKIFEAVMSTLFLFHCMHTVIFYCAKKSWAIFLLKAQTVDTLPHNARRQCAIAKQSRTPPPHLTFQPKKVGLLNAEAPHFKQKANEDLSADPKLQEKKTSQHIMMKISNESSGGLFNTQSITSHPLVFTMIKLIGR